MERPTARTAASADAKKATDTVAEEPASAAGTEQTTDTVVESASSDAKKATDTVAEEPASAAGTEQTTDTVVESASADAERTTETVVDGERGERPAVTRRGGPRAEDMSLRFFF